MKQGVRGAWGVTDSPGGTGASESLPLGQPTPALPPAGKWVRQWCQESV